MGYEPAQHASSMWALHHAAVTEVRAGAEQPCQSSSRGRSTCIICRPCALACCLIAAQCAEKLKRGRAKPSCGYVERVASRRGDGSGQHREVQGSERLSRAARRGGVGLDELSGLRLEVDSSILADVFPIPFQRRALELRRVDFGECAAACGRLQTQGHPGEHDVGRPGGTA